MVPISEDLCWAIVRMAPFLSIDNITAFTGVSREKVFLVLALYRTTGNVVKPLDHRKLGRRRCLTLDDVAVSYFVLVIIS